jgi:hypothetical protein
MSRPSSAKALIGAFAAVVLLFIALIAMELRTPAREAAAAPPRGPAPVTTPANFPPPEPKKPPVAPGVSQGTASKSISLKEIPFPVPYLTNAADRAAFKRWWTQDFATRLDLWKHEHPGKYPDSQSIAAQLYDASEPAPGQDDAHHRELSARLGDFMKTYGTSPGSVISWSGQKHTAPKPPPGFAIEESEPTFDVASTTAPEGFVPGKQP